MSNLKLVKKSEKEEPIEYGTHPIIFKRGRKSSNDLVGFLHLGEETKDRIVILGKEVPVKDVESGILYNCKLLYFPKKDCYVAVDIEKVKGIVTWNEKDLTVTVNYTNGRSLVYKATAKKYSNEDAFNVVRLATGCSVYNKADVISDLKKAIDYIDGLFMKVDVSNNKSVADMLKQKFENVKISK